MSTLFIGLLGAALSTNAVSAVSNVVAETTGISVKAPDTEDPVEKEFRQIELDDDAAHDEVDRWIRENQEFKKQGAGTPDAELNQRIMKRLDKVRAAYQDFIQHHPNHAKARIAYASFLDGIGEEDEEVQQLEKARQLDPKDPAAWNNLANYYGHRGPVKTAFEYYEKALTLDPTEPVYYHNFGTTVYLFRKDAREYFGITEQQVFDKALKLYSNSMRLDPTNFALASDVAQSYYGIRPLRTNDALVAWTNALAIATDEIEREGVYLHLARVKMAIGRFGEARAHLNSVTNETYTTLKERLERNLKDREKGVSGPPAWTSPADESPTNGQSSPLQSTNTPAKSSGERTNATNPAQ